MTKHETFVMLYAPMLHSLRGAVQSHSIKINCNYLAVLFDKLRGRQGNYNQINKNKR